MQIIQIEFCFDVGNNFVVRFLPDSLIRQDWGGTLDFIHDVYPAPNENQKDMWFRSTFFNKFSIFV